MSIAGGYFKAVEAASAAGCDCVQLFTKNNNQWRAKAITDDDARLFREKLAELDIVHPLSHASYLINLARPDPALRQKSIDAMIVELERANSLGIPYVVVHPGSYTTSDEETGLANIVNSIDAVHRGTSGVTSQILLENTAGQGTNLGAKFEHLGTVIRQLESPKIVGVCIDTCHAFAAGYPLSPQVQYETTIKKLARAVGLRRIKAFHLNDSKKPLGSRVDRHEHIGRGEIGLDGFRHLLNDPRFRQTPMYLETPKGTEKKQDFDELNLNVLRSLVE